MAANRPSPIKPNVRRNQPLRVAIMVNNAEGYARGVLRGIMPYAFSHGWECDVVGVSDQDRLEPIGPVAGIIAQISGTAALVRVAELALPTVNVSSSLYALDIPAVVNDDLAIGRIGAEHFTRRGFHHLLYYAPIENHYARLRQQGFASRATEIGISAVVAPDRPTLARLLFELPKPLGVMCCNDSAALAVLEQCRIDHLKVPDQVAVLGVDNDDLVQSLAFPPLSSIATSTEQIGFEAAALLHRLIQKRKSPGVTIAPIGVITRQSSDLTAVDDTDVAEALRYIREHAASPIGVQHILRAVTVSRRQLERRFRARLGRSLLEELRRCRVERARQLLVETNLTIPQIATASGFGSASYMTVVFNKTLGEPPGALRRRKTESRVATV